MSFVRSGSCPKCGAPIWSPMVWQGLTPPPNHFTCNCVEHAVVVTTNIPNQHLSILKNEAVLEEIKKITNVVEELSEKIKKLEKEFEQERKPKSSTILKG